MAAAALMASILPRALLAQDTNAAKARALTDAAIKMTDSSKAVKLLWQATDIDPTLDEPYIYLGLYYQAKEDPADLVKVYQKLIKYRPTLVTGYLNVGEAYMQFQPPKTAEALPFYMKARELDPTSAFAALRIGEIKAQQGDRAEAIHYLCLARSDKKNSNVPIEADKMLREMGSSCP